MGGIMSYLKPLAVGTISGIAANRLADYVPIVRQVPFFKGIAGGAGAYMAGSRGWAKIAVGAGSGEILSQPIGTAAGQAIGMRIF
jgi:hypothetical protein